MEFSHRSRSTEFPGLPCGRDSLDPYLSCCQMIMTTSKAIVTGRRRNKAQGQSLCYSTMWRRVSYQRNSITIATTPFHLCLLPTRVLSPHWLCATYRSHIYSRADHPEMFSHKVTFPPQQFPPTRFVDRRAHSPMPCYYQSINIECCPIRGGRNLEHLTSLRSATLHSSREAIMCGTMPHIGIVADLPQEREMTTFPSFATTEVEEGR